MEAASKGTQRSLQRSYSGTTDTLNQARCDLVELLQMNGLHVVVADAELVLSELASNAVEASPHTNYRVFVELADDTLLVAVTNNSKAALPAEADRIPEDVLAPQGRGLMIVHALSDSVDVIRTESEITVSARLTLPRR